MGWAELIYAIVALVASYVISAYTARSAAVDSKPAVFSDFDFPQADESTPQAVIFGDVWSGNWMVLYVGNYQIRPIKSSSGKK